MFEGISCLEDEISTRGWAHNSQILGGEAGNAAGLRDLPFDGVRRGGPADEGRRGLVVMLTAVSQSISLYYSSIVVVCLTDVMRAVMCSLSVSGVAYRRRKEASLSPLSTRHLPST